MFYFKDKNQVTVYFANGDVAVWKSDHPQFNKVVNKCLRNDWEEVELVHNQTKAIMTGITFVDDEGNVVLERGDKKITLQDKENALLNLIRIMKNKGVIDSEIESIKPFLYNCLENPYINAVQEIYDYCKAMDFEITEDGCFLAYKNVNKDLTSVHDGKTQHTIGEYVEVSQVDTNRNNTCSQGLHFCSRSYLTSFSGEVTLIVKINPIDVVSIPTDYNFAKGRCRKYQVVGIIAKGSNLNITNMKVATGQNIIKTEVAKADAIQEARKDNRTGNRLDETVKNMEIYGNNKAKVAQVMNISVDTVSRNILKFKACNG